VARLLLFGSNLTVLKDISNGFGIIVRERRTLKKLSQESLAEKAGLHPTYIGLVERGQRSPTLRAAQALALALGVSLAVLVAEAENIQGKKG
jgi:transcriptional regulator with XRE-family HTH domain